MKIAVRQLEKREIADYGVVIVMDSSKNDVADLLMDVEV